MVGPAYILRDHEVLMTLHSWGATLGSEGVGVVTDIDPVCPGVSPVGGGQAGGIGQGQGGHCDGGDGVHHSYSSDSVVMINSQLMLPFISGYCLLFKDMLCTTSNSYVCIISLLPCTFMKITLYIFYYNVHKSDQVNKY